MDETTNDPRICLTAHRMGWSSTEPHEINLNFCAFASGCRFPVLDIGAGFGAATLAALNAGATVIVNDIDHQALAALEARIPAGTRERFHPRPGRFPLELDFANESLGAIHACNVLHFLHPADLEVGIQQMHGWLCRGGKVFVMVNSAYGGNFKGYIPFFLDKKRGGGRWPGWVEDLRLYSSHPTLSHLPASLHLFDAEILEASFRAVGFIIEEVKEFRRSGLPESLWYDGREKVLLIARK